MRTTTRRVVFVSKYAARIKLLSAMGPARLRLVKCMVDDGCFALQNSW